MRHTFIQVGSLACALVRASYRATRVTKDDLIRYNLKIFAGLLNCCLTTRPTVATFACTRIAIYCDIIRTGRVVQTFVVDTVVNMGAIDPGPTLFTHTFGHAIQRQNTLATIIIRTAIVRAIDNTERI